LEFRRVLFRSMADQSGSAGPNGARPKTLRLWRGRFQGDPDQALARLSLSTHFDWRLARHDIAGSRAHARALHRVGLLTDDELDRMIDGLGLLETDVASGPSPPYWRTTTYTPRWNVASSHVSAPNWAVDCARADPATTRSPPWCACICGKRLGRSPTNSSTWPRLWRIRPRPTPRQPCPDAPIYNTPNPYSWRTNSWHTPGRSCETWNGCVTGTDVPQRPHTDPAHWPVPPWAWTPRPSAPNWVFRVLRRTPSTVQPPATSSRSSRSSPP